MRSSAFFGQILLILVLLGAPTIADEGFTFNGLVTLLKENNVETVAEAVQSIAKNRPEYVKRYRIMKDSASLQRGKRIILTGKESKFMVSFTPSRNQDAGGALETMEFDEKKDKFVFRSIEFKAETDKSEALGKEEIKEDLGVFTVSHGNIKTCTNCHGEDSRPNWATYNIWDRTLGSVVGVHDGGRGYFEIVGKDKEKDFLKKFEEARRKNSRLKSLPPYQEHLKKQDFADDNDINKTISKQLNAMNGRRIARIIDEESRLERYRLILLGIFYCEIPQDKRSDFIKKAVGVKEFKRMESKLGSFESFDRGLVKENWEYQVEKLNNVREFMGIKNVKMYDGIELISDWEIPYRKKEIAKERGVEIKEIKTSEVHTRHLTEQKKMVAALKREISKVLEVPVSQVTKTHIANASFGERDGPQTSMLHYIVESAGVNTLDWPMVFGRTVTYHDGGQEVVSVAKPLAYRLSKNMNGYIKDLTALGPISAVHSMGEEEGMSAKKRKAYCARLIDDSKSRFQVKADEVFETKSIK